MFSFNDLPSPSSLMYLFTSIMGYITIFRSVVYEKLPQPIRDHLKSKFLNWFNKPAVPMLTLVFDESHDFLLRDDIFPAADVYLDTLRSPETKRLNVRKCAGDEGLVFRLGDREEVTDFYKGTIELHWKVVCHRQHKDWPEKRSFELSFRREHENEVRECYIDHVVNTAKSIREKKKALKIYTLRNIPDGTVKWDPVNFESTATFENLAMDQDKRTDIIEDLNRFVGDEKFYKKIGKAWKRCYLLYGPPGTGKTSLVSAIAKHLNYDIYYLQLSKIRDDDHLTRVLLSTTKKSIILVEDIDCSAGRQLDRRLGQLDHQDGNSCASPSVSGNRQASTSFTLSGLLNVTDGLFSSCADERIFIFTTNYKERLDDALVRPGRVDKPTYMGHCTFEAFKQLVSVYYEITGDHKLYGEIESLIGPAKVTTALVTGEFLKCRNADVALEEFLKLLKRKIMKGDDDDDECEGNNDENENDNVVLLELQEPNGTN